MSAIATGSDLKRLQATLALYSGFAYNAAPLITTNLELDYVAKNPIHRDPAYALGGNLSRCTPVADA